nr:MAG TPA: hypothetical protein [Caudoviricetes sp.]
MFFVEHQNLQKVFSLPHLSSYITTNFLFCKITNFLLYMQEKVRIILLFSDLFSQKL